jgi:hypothetical protein
MELDKHETIAAVVTNNGGFKEWDSIQEKVMN